jgi:hypothetical protein
MHQQPSSRIGLVKKIVVTPPNTTGGERDGTSQGKENGLKENKGDIGGEERKG